MATSRLMLTMRSVTKTCPDMEVFAVKAIECGAIRGNCRGTIVPRYRLLPIVKEMLQLRRS